MQKAPKIILGIDPGTLVMGYGLIKIHENTITLVEMSILKLNAKKDNYERLQAIHEKIGQLILQFKPDSFAIEAPFFGKNVQSMLKLGRAQGVAIAAAMSAGVKVCEYSPKKVKQSITGNGNADKEQVWKMLQQIMTIPAYNIKFLDASDALAVAVCHHFQDNAIVPEKSKSVKGWKDFMLQNPDRIKAG